jgi:heme-degrading monooxygenase HmoA
MLARYVTMKLRADSVTKFARIIDTEVVPLLRKQEGYMNQITLISPERVEAAVITFWHTKETEEAFNRTQNPEVLEKLLGVIEGTPRIDIFEVVSSSFEQY